MIIPLYLAIGYLFLTSIIFWMNRRDFTPLLSDEPDFPYDAPLVSICIPARNEEHNIGRAIDSLAVQNYPNYEILILDDQSTDRTPEILDEYQQKNPELLSIINGKQKPGNWLGKSWACHQLSNKAKGNLLFFMDADVWLAENTIQRTVRSMQHLGVDFITIWPIQQMGTFWEKVVIPVIYYGLLTLLPARWVHGKPGWISASTYQKYGHHLAAACGQCMIFRRKAYKAIGGHESVKKDIVEDVALARQIKRNGFSMLMFHGDSAVWCRMYRSGAEMWSGFRKNFLALYNNSLPAFILMALVNFIVYVWPVIAFVIGICKSDCYILLLSGFALSLAVGQRLILAKWFHWQKKMAFLHPLSVLWFHVLGIRVLVDHFSDTRAKWKNRPT